MKKILLLLIFFSGSLYAQPPIAQPNDLEVCDQNNDGFESFDLTLTIEEILNGLDASAYTVVFFTSESDAQTGSSPIPNPTSFINSTNPQTIYVRVFENGNPSNFEITNFDLIINSQPSILEPSDLILYESPFDELAVFDLSTQTAFLTNGLSTAFVSYYTTEADAFSNIGMIVNTTAFENSTNPQTIYCRVEDIETGCYSVTNFDLIVLEDNIVFIPDANFKAKLLSANTTNQIAMNSQFQYFKIDANNDGEIQFSEASEVFFLKINNSFLPNPSTILSLIGIESFVNLKELNASLNNISTFNYNLPFLEKLYFTANNLTTIDLTGTPQLIELDLNQNSISNLDVSVCENLVSLGCDYNSLSSLDISMLSNLNNLSVRYNQLTSLDLSQSETLISLQLAGNNFLPVLNNLVNLESLNCQGMSLSDLDISSNVNLSTLVLSQNNFTEIVLPSLPNLTTFLCSEMTSLMTVNVNMAPSLTFFQCINNSSLQSIFMKNGVQSFQSLNWAENFNLQYVCVDEFLVNNIVTYLNSIQLTNVNVNSFCSFTPGGDYNTITGNVRLDSNNNGCNETDFSIPFFKLAVDLNAMTTNSSVFSNNNGVYNLYTATEGVYTLTPVLENPAYFSVSPEPGTAIINQIDNSSTTLDFCVTANGVHPDLEV
ncbi:MAG: hypothetical protein J0M25_12110, partial [Flavobacteriales bacterium]|nr:hypothetical protein [Flavobacteriales bacterium]